MGLRRIFRRFPVLAARAEALWRHVSDPGLRQGWMGPVKNLACLLRDAQLTWSTFGTITTRQGRVLQLWTGSSTWLAHRLREELRWSRLQQVTRKDFQGIHVERGINTFATTCLLRGGLSHPAVKQLVPSQSQLAALAGGSLSTYSLGVLEGILSGAATAQYQLEKMNLADNTTCPYCTDNVDETKQHMYWECSAWDYIRQATIGRLGPALWRRHGEVVTRCVGITLMPEWIATEWQRLSAMEQSVPSRPSWNIACHQVIEDDRGVLIWTDGSTSHATIPDLTRSGIGIFFKDESQLNFSAALAGERQTNNRAELLAVTLAAELGVLWGRAVVIHTDSDWVHRRSMTLCDLADVPLNWEHRDLWLRLRTACVTIPISFVLVPAHLSLNDCAVHGVDPLVVRGNHAADSLAKEGVAQHQHAEWNRQLRNYAQLLEDTMWIQFCMICVCLARQQRDSERPAPAETPSFPAVLRGWDQLRHRLEQAAVYHPTGRQRYWFKAPPLNEAAPDEVHIDIELEEGRARPRRPRPVHAHTLRRPPRLGEVTNTEWTDVPKPWLLLCKSESSKRVATPGMTIQLGVKPALLPSMEWYLGQLVWVEDGRSQSVSFLELALDFEIATGVKVSMPKVANPDRLGQRGRAFYAAASAVGRYVDRRPWPVGFSSQPVRSLYHAFGLPRTAGLAWRPGLLHEDAVRAFFVAASSVHYTSDADFFNQTPPLLVPDREQEWDAKVRRVPIYVRRQEKLEASNEPGPFEWCVQVTGGGSEVDSGSAVQPVSTKLSKKLTDWNKKQERVTRHNATAAAQGKHWIELPPAPDFSLSGDRYNALIREAKIQCKWCKRTRCLSVIGDFMKVTCPGPS